jgi:hypothetical protein
MRMCAGVTDSNMDFPRAHPDCEHCGTVSRALVNWAQTVHDLCPCLCHIHKTSKARATEPKPKAKGKKR